MEVQLTESEVLKARVRTLQSQLLHLCDTLNDKVSAVLAKQEKEFLRAYRSHMYTVQQELQSLRAKADDASLALAKNERILALEAERDWYRTEALRLDRSVTALKGEAEYNKGKLQALEDDRTWLEAQLKAARRKLKIGEELDASRPLPPSGEAEAGAGEPGTPSRGTPVAARKGGENLRASAELFAKLTQKTVGVASPVTTPRRAGAAR